jgi:hypothetical protein
MSYKRWLPTYLQGRIRPKDIEAAFARQRSTFHSKILSVSKDWASILQGLKHEYNHIKTATFILAYLLSQGKDWDNIPRAEVFQVGLAIQMEIVS